jgi:hypothetical protein
MPQEKRKFISVKERINYEKQTGKNRESTGDYDTGYKAEPIPP